MADVVVWFFVVVVLVDNLLLYNIMYYTTEIGRDILWNPFQIDISYTS
jgi:hypothetical protein